MEELDAKNWLAVMCMGLCDIQKKGIVHLDTHCANYNNDENGFPILLDFGCS